MFYLFFIFCMFFCLVYSYNKMTFDGNLLILLLKTHEILL